MFKRALLGYSRWPGEPRIEVIIDADFIGLVFRLVQPFERETFEAVTRGRAAKLPAARTLSRRKALAAIAFEAARALEWELSEEERVIIKEFAEDRSLVKE